VDFAGGDVMAERFASGGKPSTLLYHKAHHEHGQWQPHLHGSEGMSVRAIVARLGLSRAASGAPPPSAPAGA